MTDETTPNGEEPETQEAAGPDAVETPEASEPLVDDDPILALQTEVGVLKDQLMRALAETDNVRKRSERQLSDERVYAIEKFAKDLLPVSDNLARALEVLSVDARADLSEPGQKLLEGVELTQKDLHAVLARNGVSAIDAAPGAAFDPNQHQAVSQIPSEYPSGSVASTFQSGWKIGDRTLRAAMVAVSSGAPAAEAPIEPAPEAPSDVSTPGEILDTKA